MTRFLRPAASALLIGIVGLGAGFHSTNAQQTSTPTSTPIPSNCPDDPALQASQEGDIVAAVNKARVAANLNPVQINKLLDVASQRQSNDMAGKDFLDHTGSDGSDVGARVTAAGYVWGNVGENILVRNDMSAAGAYDQWWNSPGHKANMMNPDFAEIGVTFACTVPNAKYYYTMVLATALNGGANSSANVSATADANATMSATDVNSGDNASQSTPTPDQ